MATNALANHAVGASAPVFPLGPAGGVFSGLLGVRRRAWCSPPILCLLLGLKPPPGPGHQHPGAFVPTTFGGHRLPTCVAGRCRLGALAPAWDSALWPAG